MKGIAYLAGPSFSRLKIKANLGFVGNFTGQAGINNSYYVSESQKLIQETGAKPVGQQVVGPLLGEVNLPE